MDGIWTEAKKADGINWKIWKPANRGKIANYCRISLSGFPYRPLAMCKIAKLSYVAGAEVAKRYLLG